MYNFNITVIIDLSWLLPFFFEGEGVVTTRLKCTVMQIIQQQINNRFYINSKP